MRMVSKIILGLLSVVGMAGCGAPSQTDVAQEGTVGEQTSALTFTELSKGIRHDFNGDGIEDLLVVQTSGTTLLPGRAIGGFSSPTWSRGDLQYGNTSYAVGDFNGDHRSDLIILTTYGSYEYLGTASGGFIQDVWVRNDLTIYNTEYVVGDFNYDGRSDLIITTPNGTWEYLGKVGGGFDSYWSHGMVKGSVKFTTGDFNGDGTTDLIFTHAGGTTLYTGTAGTTGGFTPNVWISYDYLLDQCSLFPGDFNGDGKFDLIAQNYTDARELLGSASGAFTSTWIHPEYQKQSQTNFVPGDYNGGGTWDLVVAEGTGTSLLPGQWFGGFATRTWYRMGSTIDSYHSAFTAGDFTGDSRDDLIVIRDDTGMNEYKGQTSGASNAVYIGPIPLLSTEY